MTDKRPCPVCQTMTTLEMNDEGVWEYIPIPTTTTTTKHDDRAAVRAAFVELVESGLVDEDESPVALLDTAFAVTP